ncbi:MAG: hypothetical protein L0Y73_05470 [Candidatus Aminicenantes bacterium]|nr:hypothetical protein [Candidatus Aminicenantes bacterium]
MFCTNQVKKEILARRSVHGQMSQKVTAAAGGAARFCKKWGDSTLSTSFSQLKTLDFSDLIITH